MGPPGSGKDTQAQLLSNNLEMEPIETSKIFEAKVKKSLDEPEIKKAYDKFKTGKLFKPQFAYKIVKEYTLQILATNKTTKGFVFNGSPRTLYEANKLSHFLIKTFDRDNIFVFYLKVPLAIALKRLLARKICDICKRPINPELIINNPDLKTCNLCGGNLIRRSIDTPDIIKTRFKVYLEQTHPIVDYLKKMGFKKYTINGKQSIKKVYNQIISYLKIK